jgi:hypothetical protein
MTAYIGSGPYCYANSLAMVLGPGAPPPAVLEVLTGSPFGFELLGGRLPFFDPYGWDPDRGLNDAIGLLGWACRRTGAQDGAEALATLRTALRSGPALVGPVEMGLFRHQPGMTAAVGADHFVAVLEADDELVRFHDPHGQPWRRRVLDRRETGELDEVADTRVIHRSERRCQPRQQVRPQRQQPAVRAGPEHNVRQRCRHERGHISNRRRRCRVHVRVLRHQVVREVPESRFHERQVVGCQPSKPDGRVQRRPPFGDVVPVLEAAPVGFFEDAA